MNPHSPTDAWLAAVAGNRGYEADPEPGDSGEETLERDGRTYRVTVEVLDE